jgi:DNA repair ATPase RecN
MKLEDIDLLKKKLQDHLATVGKERDKIDETLDELNSLKNDCEDAEESIFDAIRALDDARDALSRLV